MRLVSVLALTLLAALGASGQNVGARGASGIEVEIAEQPDCPIKILLEAPAVAMPAFSVKLQNTDPRAVEGYVLVIYDGASKQVHTTVRPVKTLTTETSIFQSTGLSKPGKFLVSVDYVRFADGSSWGGDEFGRSKYITAFLKGRELAIDRLKNLAGGAVPDALQRVLDAFGSYSFGEPANFNHPDADGRQTLVGYRTVIQLLRGARSETEEAQDLARKLELMENDLR